MPIQRYLSDGKWLDVPDVTAPIVVSAVFDENGQLIEGSEMVMQPLKEKSDE